MTRKRVAIVQSSYIPWKGYFDLIRASDEFILLDEVQFTKRDWRSRNRIKTPHGLAWLTVPVASKGLYHQLIQDTCISDPRWSRTHWATLRGCYARAPFFPSYESQVAALYDEVGGEQRLSQVNYRLTAGLCRLLGIATPIVWSREYGAFDGKNERLIDLCRAARATHYLSGPSARAYLDARLFGDAGITLEFADYAGYPEYAQLYPPFEHHVSILDLLFATGPDAVQCMKAL